MSVLKTKVRNKKEHSGGRAQSRFTRRGIGGIAVAGAALFASSLGPVTVAGAVNRNSTPITTITFANSITVPSSSSLWDWSPYEFGFFKQEGLQVNYLWDNGGSVAFPQVADGQATFGESSLENLDNAIQAGIPLHPISSLITSNIYSTAVLASSPITKWAQLSGGTIGVSSLTSGSYPFTAESVAQFGLKGEVKYTIVGSGGPQAQALQSGQVTALTALDSQWPTIESLGVKLRFLPKPSVSSLPEDELYTSNSYYAAHKDIVIKFAAAVYAGIDETALHPASVISYFKANYPSDATPIDTPIMIARLDHSLRIPAQHGQWGYSPLALYARVQALGIQYGVINKPGINIRNILSNRDVPAIDKKVKTLVASVKK